MSGILYGVERTGTWEFLEESNQLQIVINIGAGEEPVLFDIGKSSDQILTLTYRNGNRYRSMILVEKAPESNLKL